MLLPELAAIYEALESGRRPVLPEPILQYGDYAVWRRQQVTGEVVASQMQYWQRNLAGELPMVQLPFDHPRPASLSYAGAMETFRFPASVITALKALSGQANVTPYMTLLASFKALLYRYTRQEDLLIGGVVDMRRRPELENLMGYFLNAVVLRTRPSNDLTFHDYLMQVRDTVLGALGASEAPFERVVRELQTRRDPVATRCSRSCSRSSRRPACSTAGT